MATRAHCAYCFESVLASFDHREPPSLAHIEQLWAQHMSGTDDEEKKPKSSLLKIPAALKSRASDSPSSSPSTPSRDSTASTPSSNAHQTPASSANASDISLSDGGKAALPPSPMFVTWNTLSAGGGKSLRGCIGTFEALEIEKGLHTYALTSAFEDTRFAPIARSELRHLSAEVTLLTDFEPAADPLAWTVGQHGIRLSFTHGGRRFGATYLPDVAREQGWTKEEALVSLMRKAGWTGRRDEWQRVADMRVVRYQGKKVSLPYGDWAAFRARAGLSS